MYDNLDELPNQNGKRRSRNGDERTQSNVHDFYAALQNCLVGRFVNPSGKMRKRIRHRVVFF